jgi:hypothetical protein
MNTNQDEPDPKLMMALITNLTVRVETLEKERPGRKPLPVVVSEEHVCGVDPSRDSATCPDASLYRRQQKCKGDRCVSISQEYYAERRATKG